ncbi:MAG: putative Ig domain-containing protein [Planctomycetota bacterium]
MSRRIFFWGAWVAFFAVSWTCIGVRAETIDPNQYGTWGLSNDNLAVPSGQIITEAVLTIHGLTNLGESASDTLSIYLLDNPSVDFNASVEEVSGDIFANSGIILEPPYRDMKEGTEEITYTLSQLSDESSSVWQFFGYPFEFALADSSIVNYSSSLLSIIDYGGTGTSFGFGFDPNGFNGYRFDGMSLDITVESYQGLPEKSVLTFTHGITNWPPVLAPVGDKTVAENARLIFNVSATDADGDTLVYSTPALPPGATLAGDTFVWTPTYSQAGTYQATFNASDGQNADSETITITVSDTNREPVLSNIGAKSTNENQTLIFNISAADADGDIVIYNAPALPPGATFAGDTFTWTPTYDQAGTYQATFVANDGRGADSETITITVSDINRAPVLSHIGAGSIDENKTLTFKINATDADGDAVVYSVPVLPPGATFAGDTFTWKPTYNQAGTYQVIFVANDGRDTDSKTITITVNDINRAPVLSSIGTRSANENKILMFSINATDADGDIVVYNAPLLPPGATFEGDTFRWTPTYDQAGTYQATFVANDGKDSDSETVTIIAYDINRAPVLSSIGPKSTEENQTLTFSISATDADGDFITYSVPAPVLPTGATFVGNTFTWTPTYDQAGTYRVTFIARDARGVDYETITITVSNVDNGPVLGEIESKSLIPRKKLSFSISATDPDGDPVTYSAQGLPEGATFIDKTFTWMPWYDQAGSYAITFIASDGNNNSSRTITITVMQPVMSSWYENWLKHINLL